jgi:uncharacterized protein YegL
MSNLPELLEQVPFPEPEFVDNPEPRCPCVLLLDTSGSMNDERVVSTALSPVQQLLQDSLAARTLKPIDELNAGLVAFQRELLADELAVKRIEIAVVTFGPVKLLSDFQSPDLFRPPRLNAEGDTPLGAAIERAVELIGARKAAYKQNGISYYRPWIFLLTDGEPTDDWQRAAQLVRVGEQSKAFAFFAIGVEGAKFDILRQISVRQPLRLNGLPFREMFRWLSASLSAVSRSSPGDEIALKNPASPDGWASL